MTARTELARLFDGVDKLTDDGVREVAHILTGDPPPIYSATLDKHPPAGAVTMDEYLARHFGLTRR
jgi:hypothetical protein